MTEMTEEKEFYRYFAVDYVATGEGRSIWLMICRNYSPIDDKDREYEKFVKFVELCKVMLSFLLQKCHVCFEFL